MATVHTELSSFLTDVWENRDHILFGPSASSRKRDTVEDRVYEIYAPGFARNGAISPEDYDGQIRTLRPTGRAWQYRESGGFHVWSSPVGGSPAHRLYLNVLPRHVTQAMTVLFRCAVTPITPSVVPPVPGRMSQPSPMGQPLDPSPQVLAAGIRARVQRGYFSDVVVSAKVADKAEAFTGRADKMVVYLNDLAGETAVHLLARQLGAQQSWFAPDIPPMTRRLAMGLSCGPEVSGAQWGAGTSFGELRCNLIARALIETVTGKTIAELSDKQKDHHPSGKFMVVLAPLPHLRPVPRIGGQPGRSPNRLDFLALVNKLFAQHQIDPGAPWAKLG